MSDGYPLGADCDVDAIVAFHRPADDDPVVLMCRRFEAAFVALAAGDLVHFYECLDAP